MINYTDNMSDAETKEAREEYKFFRELLQKNAARKLPYLTGLAQGMARSAIGSCRNKPVGAPCEFEVTTESDFDIEGVCNIEREIPHCSILKEPYKDKNLARIREF
jgi:hypothetical protein